METRSHARNLAQKYLDKQDPLGWFEELYSQASDDLTSIPWADLEPNPNLVQWLQNNPRSWQHKKAVVVGCGLGDDAEELAQHGLEVTAFDISQSAIQKCQQRFSNSKVIYEVHNLLDDQPAWHNTFDFILESYTLQVLPHDLQKQAMKQAASWLAPQGSLLVICRGRDQADDPGSMPWPLTKTDLDHFLDHGLQEKQFEDYQDQEDPPVRRFRAEYTKAQ